MYTQCVCVCVWWNSLSSAKKPFQKSWCLVKFCEMVYCQEYTHIHSVCMYMYKQSLIELIIAKHIFIVKGIVCQFWNSSKFNSSNLGQTQYWTGLYLTAQYSYRTVLLKHYAKKLSFGIWEYICLRQILWMIIAPCVFSGN